MDILLIEDDDYKKNKVIECLNVNFNNTTFSIAKSVTSAVLKLEQLDKDTIVLLDMSLPTYDLDLSSSGGRPQGFGGIEILRNMDFQELDNKVIVITQYESIPLGNRVVEINDLKIELADEFEEMFFGLVQFSVVSDKWKNDLIKMINEIMNA